MKLEANLGSKVEIPKSGNKAFTDGGAKEVIQLKPQFINIYLAKGKH